MFRKVLANTHWLIGITLGTVLALMGFTGAAMVFGDEIVAALNHFPDHVTARGKPLDLNALIARIRAQNPDKHIAWLAVSADPQTAVRVDWVRAARRGPTEDESGYRVDPYTGDMMNVSTERGRAFIQSMEGLHRRLTWRSPGAGPGPAPAAGPPPGAPAPRMSPAGQPPPPQAGVGQQLTSLAALSLLVMVGTGLYLRWPQRKARDWRSWLKINFRLRGYAFLFNLHVVIGTVVLLGYLISAHSGLVMSEQRWYSRGVYQLAGLGDTRGGGGGGPGGGAGLFGAAAINDRPYDFNRLWDAFRREAPDFHTATLQFSRSNEADFRITYLTHKPVTSHGGNGGDTVVLDANAGNVKEHQRFFDTPLVQRLVSRNFDLHSGSYFGLPGRLFILCTSLMMPVLYVTGWMQYLARRRQKRLRRAQAAALAEAG